MKKGNKQDLEETTKCGEVIPTNFMWMSLDRQKERAQEIADISKKNKK